jgi:hypothetical protein
MDMAHIGPSPEASGASTDRTLRYTLDICYQQSQATALNCRPVIGAECFPSTTPSVRYQACISKSTRIELAHGALTRSPRFAPIMSLEKLHAAGRSVLVLMHVRTAWSLPRGLIDSRTCRKTACSLFGSKYFWTSGKR